MNTETASGRSRAISLCLLLAASIGGCSEPLVESPKPAGNGGKVPLPNPASATANSAPKAPPVRKPLPPAPATDEARRAGLLRLLERGDSVQIRFAQDLLATDPDVEGTAKSLLEASDRYLLANSAYVTNMMTAVRSPELTLPLIPLLRRCMESQDPALQRIALQAYTVHAPNPDPALLGPVTANVLYTVALDAVEGLRRIGTPAAAKVLCEAFPQMHPAARPFACIVMGQIGDMASAPLLRGVLDAEEAEGGVFSQEALAAAAGLVALGDERGVTVLRAWVADLPPDAPPGTAEDVLSAAGDDAPLPRLLALVRTGPAPAAVAALDLITRYRDRPEVAVAVETALRREEMEVILHSLSAMKDLGDGAYMARTLAAFHAPDTDRRYAAALALGRFKDPSTLETMLKRLFEDPDSVVRHKIADALGILEDPRAAPALVKYLLTETETDPVSAWTAFNARFNIRGAIIPAAAPLLIEALKKGMPVAPRCHALGALGMAKGAEGARQTVESFLLDANAEVRRAAALALGTLGDAAAREPLVTAYMKEPDDGVAEVMAESVLRVDLSAAIPSR
jgi:HEAT repeat protein